MIKVSVVTHTQLWITDDPISRYVSAYWCKEKGVWYKTGQTSSFTGGLDTDSSFKRVATEDEARLLETILSLKSDEGMGAVENSK